MSKKVKVKNAGLLYALVAIAVVFLFILFAVLAKGGDVQQPATGDSSTVSAQGDTQYIEITAKAGGYYPKTINAKAGVKTIVKFVTNKAYGCETAMTIPSLGITKNLPPTGVTEIEIGTGQQGKDLLITCLMRMYSATIKFS